MTTERSLITDELRARVGAAGEPRSFVVERAVAARLTEALGEDPEQVLAAAYAPVFYVAAFETNMAEDGVPANLGQSVLAGDDWELRRPLRWGERLNCVGRLVDVYERFSGRYGQTLFVRHEWTFTDTDGEAVAVGRRVFARSFPSGAAEETEAP